MKTSDLDDARLDRRLRACHAEAVDRVSAATMAQLHRRRGAAVAGRAGPRFTWPLPAALAAVLAIAVGLGFALRGLGDPASPADAPPALAQDGGEPLEDVLDGLDQNPDFYAWLASSDADLLAME